MKLPSPARPRRRSPAHGRREDRAAASSSPTPPRKSRWRARSSPSARARRNEQGQLVALDVKAGDRILFGKWSGTEVKLDGEELLIMKESDIMGIIDTRVAKAAETSAWSLTQCLAGPRQGRAASGLNPADPLRCGA